MKCCMKRNMTYITFKHTTHLTLLLVLILTYKISHNVLYPCETTVKVLLITGKLAITSQYKSVQILNRLCPVPLLVCF